MRTIISFLAVFCVSFFAHAEVRSNVTLDIPVKPGMFSKAFTFACSMLHDGYTEETLARPWPNGMVVSYRSGYYDGWRLHLHDAAESRPVFEIGRPEGATSVEGSVSVTRGTWHRIAVSWEPASPDADLGTMRLWVDGRLAAQSAPDRPAPIMDESSKIAVGYVDFGVGALKRLSVKDARFEPRALTAAEIESDMAHAPALATQSRHAAEIARAAMPETYALFENGMTRVREFEQRKMPSGEASAQRVIAVPAPSKSESANAILSRLLKNGTSNVRLEFAEGVYVFTEPFSVRDLDHVTLAAARGARVRFTASQEISRSKFVRLSQIGETNASPSVQRRVPQDARAEVLCLPEVKIAGANASIGTDDVSRRGVLLQEDGRVLHEARTAMFAATPTADGAAVKLPMDFPDEKIRLWGWWKHRWHDATRRAERREDGAYRPVDKYNYGIGESPELCVVGTPEGLRDRGSWFYDGTSLWVRPFSQTFATISVPRFEGGMLKFSKTNHLRIEGISFSGATDFAVCVESGEGTVLDGCTIRACGGDGLVLDARNAYVRNCTFSDTGFNSVVLGWRDRATQFDWDNGTFESCRFARSGQLEQTYTPNIILYGVGYFLNRCTFEDEPSSAIRVEGNENVVKDCVFRNTVLKSDDQGTIDSWGDPTFRGNVFLGNTFVDVGGDANDQCGRAAIRFDDLICGTVVASNRFERAARGNFGAIQVHQGNSHAIVGNTFVDCAKGVTVTRWEKGRWTRVMENDDILPKYAVMKTPLWFSLYPRVEFPGDETPRQLFLGNRFVNTPIPFKGVESSSVILP